MNRKQSTIISLVLFYMVSMLFFSIMPSTAFGVEIEYSKPPLYSTGYPYIKYFLDRALGSSSQFAGLTRSFQLDLGGHSYDAQQMINYGAVSYDQTILGLIVLDNEQNALLDAYVAYSKQLTDPNNPLFYAGSGYNVKYGPFRVVRILGRDVNGWWNTWDWAVDSGSAACLIEYALCAYQKTQNLDYKNLAILLGDYILSLQDTDGGVRMGPVGMWHPSGIYFYWNTKSTEQNERALYALEALYAVTQDAQYNQPINAIRNWLKDMYDKSVHLYHSASQFNGSQWINSDFGYVATDVMAFAPLELMFNDSYFGATQEERDTEIDNMFAAIEERTAFFDVQNKPKLFRLSISQTGDYGSVEWSSQMALAYLRTAQGYAQRGEIEKARGYLDKYNALVSNLENFFIAPQDDPVAKVAPYASYVNGAVAGGVPTGTGYYTYNCQAALASSYYVFAKAGYDPTKLDGGLGIPILPELDLTPPTTPVVSDEGLYTTNTSQLYAAWTANDLESGIAQYQYRITEGSVVIRDWTSVAAAGNSADVTAGGLSLTNGKVYYFAVKAKNGAGLWSEIGYSDGITVDIIPPTGTIKIKNNAAYTKTTSVTLKLSATDNVGGSGMDKMQFSNDNVNWSAPVAYATTKSWSLTYGDGTKTVYAKLLDKAGNWSAPISDTIILDTTKPNVTDISASPNPFDPEANQYTNIYFKTADNLSTSLTVYVYIYNSAGTLVRTRSGTKPIGTSYLIWNGKNASGVYVPDGVYQYRIKVVDKAGNYIYSGYYYVTKR